MTYSLLRNAPDGRMQARDEAGWHDVTDGQWLDFGNGRSVQVMGPAELGGGSFMACAIAVVLCLAGFSIAGMFDWGGKS